jgi:hypothetical protein
VTVKLVNLQFGEKLISNTDTIAEGLIKNYGLGNKSKKYARYIPFWA